MIFVGLIGGSLISGMPLSFLIIVGRACPNRRCHIHGVATSVWRGCIEFAINLVLGSIG